MYTTIQSFGVETFVKKLSYAQQSKMYLEWMKTIIFYFNIFENVIYSRDAKLNLRQPLLQSSVSHDPNYF